MNDATFREQFKPIHVPADFQEAQNLQDQVVFALAQISEGTADEVARKFEELAPKANNKLVISTVHQILADLHSKGLIAADENEGGLIYNLHKMTQANEGKVDPNLLAPGLD